MCDAPGTKRTDDVGKSTKDFSNITDMDWVDWGLLHSRHGAEGCRSNGRIPWKLPLIASLKFVEGRNDLGASGMRGGQCLLMGDGGWEGVGVGGGGAF